MLSPGKLSLSLNTWFDGDYTVIVMRWGPSPPEIKLVCQSHFVLHFLAKLTGKPLEALMALAVLAVVKLQIDLAEMSKLQTSIYKGFIGKLYKWEA